MKTLSAFFCLTLTFILTAQNASAQFVCQRAPQPVMIQGSLNVGDVQQAGRITRDGKPSSCAGDTAVLENNTALRRDTHNFVNPFNEQVCVRVEVDFSGCGGNQTQSVAYSNFNPAAPAANVIGDMGYSTINKGSYSFSVGPNASFSIGVNEIDANTGCPLYKLKVSYLRNCRQPGFDRTNDGKADLTVYRPSAISKWWTVDSETDEQIIRDFGTVGDIVNGGSDYTGDGQTDLSVYRPSENKWYYGTDQNSPGTNFVAQPWGVAGDRAVPGDFDGDGINDITVWRSSEGNFYVLRSSDGTFQQFHWGTTNDIPVSGDFDGDTVTDFAVVRQTGGGSVWWIQKSNYNYGFDQTLQWGLPTDKLVPADYDGDTITDLAIWRPSEGNFYVRRSSDLAMQVFHWGASGDIPQPADFDGDKKADFAVWRPSTGVWYINNSETGTYKVFKWGQQGDQPIAAAYRIQ
ncbi:MAG TPA: VCBS repeat-containing protein [Pyrinomonadaceae bacterium]|nr:VCBS repeat-containing protein [Pyrinomonadaceae bacterium]